MWMRGKDLADLLGCCKKTAVARAQRMGLKLELRSVRGGDGGGQAADQHYL